MEFEGKVPFAAPSTPSLWSSPNLSVAMFYGLLTVANSLQVDMKIIASGQENYSTNSYHEVSIFKMRAQSHFMLEIKLFCAALTL